MFNVGVSTTDAMLVRCNDMAHRIDEAFPAKNGPPTMYRSHVFVHRSNHQSSSLHVTGGCSMNGAKGELYLLHCT